MTASNNYHRTARPAQIESLESRRLFSSVSLSSTGVLTVTGNSAVANQLTVQRSTGGTSVVATITSGGSTLTKSFVSSKVKKVSVTGGSYGDRIDIGQRGATFTAAAIINAGAGADVIHGGPEADLINAGDGNDSIGCGAGNDTVDAGNGSDLVHGNDGNDLIHGGAGNDNLWGNNGNDTLYGEAGNDLIGNVVGTNAGYGGTGTDTFLELRTLSASDPLNDFTVGQDMLRVQASES